MKVEITVTDNEAIVSIPMGNDIYSSNIIFTKEAFIECYEKWIKSRNYGRIEDGECSACGHIIKAWADDYVRCPYCGAKMNEVEE